MNPAAVLLGFVLGSTAAITFSLTGVAIILLLLRSEHARLAGELGPLLLHLAIFTALTAVAALSFYGEIKQAGWRRVSQAGLAAALAVVVVFYWPD
jgi:hypothetical protein